MPNRTSNQASPPNFAAGQFYRLLTDWLENGNAPKDEFSATMIHERDHLRLFSHIAPEEFHAIAHHRCGACSAVARCDTHDMSAILHESHGNGLAEAVAGARDNRNLVL